MRHLLPEAGVSAVSLVAVILKFTPTQNHAYQKNSIVIKEGDWISLNGTKGLVYEGSMPLVDIDLDKNLSYKNLMKLVDKTKIWV